MPWRCLQVAQKGQDLRLDGDVERGGRLVGDQQVRVVGERHGDHHALALAARKFVRKGVEPFLGVLQADFPQQFHRAGAALVARGQPVDFENFADLPLDPVQRIERGHRLLEHHADPRAAHARNAASLGFQQVVALEKNLAAENFRARRQQAHDGQSRDRFAGAGFADQAERAAALQPQRYVIDDRRGAESDGEAFDAEEIVSRPSSASIKASMASTPVCR